MAAQQAPLSLGFSRQEHQSGLPFPCPMHDSEVAQSCLLATSWTAAYEAPPFVGFSRQEYWSGVQIAFSFFPLYNRKKKKIFDDKHDYIILTIFTNI